MLRVLPLPLALIVLYAWNKIKYFFQKKINFENFESYIYLDKILYLLGLCNTKEYKSNIKNYMFFFFINRL